MAETVTREIEKFAGLTEAKSAAINVNQSTDFAGPQQARSDWGRLEKLNLAGKQ